MAVNEESMFEYSDEEIDVVSVDPNDEKIIKFDLLSRKLLFDYDEESDCHTDTDSDTEDVMIDVVNISTVSAEINDNENNFSTLQDKSISMDSKGLKRKRQILTIFSTNFIIKELVFSNSLSNYKILDSDDSAIKTSKRNKIIENQSNIGKAATSQKQHTLSTSTKISPNKSPRSKKTRLKCVILICTNCNLKIKETEKNSKKCPKCGSNFAFCCNYCDTKFTLKNNLSNHIRYKHMDTEPVDCATCNRTYKNKDCLRRHMRFCSKSLLVCCFCSFTTKKAREMNFHLQTEHMDKLDTMEELKDVYRKIFKYEIVMQEKGVNSTSSNKPLLNRFLTLSTKSETLGTKSENLDYVSSHSSTYCSQCGKIVESTGPWHERQCRICKSITLLQCNKCNKQYRKYQSLYYHLNKVCYPKEILRCDHCAYTTPIKGELRKHMLDKHIFLENHKLKYIFLSCTKCEKRTRALDEKSDKCSRCMTNFTLSCEKCSRQLPGLREALDHLNNKCELKCHYCNLCDSKFVYKESLVKHLYTAHTKVEPIECPTCHGIFKNRLCLKVHVRTCSKPPHLLCCFCPYASKQSANIKRHLKVKHMEQIGTIEEFENVYTKIFRNGKTR